MEKKAKAEAKRIRRKHQKGGETSPPPSPFVIAMQKREAAEANAAEAAD